MGRIPEVLGLALIALPAGYYFGRIPASSGSASSSTSSSSLSAAPGADARSQILYACAVSLLAFLTTVVTVPSVAGYFSRKGLQGKDMGRRGTPDQEKQIPSALGLVCGAIYIVFVICAHLSFSKGQALADYNAALLSICFMVLLGFADDVLDLPWRYKLLLPSVASLPLLSNYHAGAGVTAVVMPSPVRALLAHADGSDLTFLGSLVETVTLGIATVHPGGRIVDLGLFYLLYMGLLAVFATNAINIYAGVNGLEAGQSLIVSLAIITANLLELASGAEGQHGYHHLLSLMLTLPFAATTGGLLVHNLYPAKVFVGDTYCYFAGMTFAVAGILGHFSKTLLLFLLPQVFNFVYSLPQLFKVYPCPRHRLPTFDANSGVMRPSTFTIAVGAGEGGKYKLVTDSNSAAAAAAAAAAEGKKDGPKPAAQAAAQAGGSGGAGGEFPLVTYHNMTLINLALRIFGPMSERSLTNLLLLLQALSCGLGLLVRYWVSGFFYDHQPAAAAT